MSFRLFVYYCAVLGGLAAYVGWAGGRILIAQHHLLKQGLKGLWVGLLIGFGLGLLDALWNQSRGRLMGLLMRALTAGFIGAAGGFLGGIAGQALYRWLDMSFFVILGWTITGTLVGASIGLFDYLAARSRREDIRGVSRKVKNGLLGGSIGGLLGGGIYLYLGEQSEKWFGDLADAFWSPSAFGFVALGLCIGLLIGLAQVLLREAWLKVESGFRSGRELILSKPLITIGRAESCDVGLFGDPSIERRHAIIQRQGSDYVITDDGSQSGTYVNDELLTGPRVLHTGDAIRVGRCVLRFGERAKARR
jgi:hypothetical protein